MSQIIPTSGPTTGNTDVIINGRGFVHSKDQSELPRCRFGSPSNYATVEAEILSYSRIVCRSPPGLTLTRPSASPIDIPFGVALTSDVFDPWTETAHKFRYYHQPEIELIQPVESTVGILTEIVV